MPYESRWPLSAPYTSVPSFVFGAPTATVDNSTKIIIDSRRPESHSFTLHSLREWTKRFATGLRAAGIKHDDRIMLVSGNSFWSPVLTLGVLMAGGIYSSGNPASTPRELAYQIKDSEPSLIFAVGACVAGIHTAADSIGYDRARIYQFDDFSSIDYAASLIQHSSPLAVRAKSWSQLFASPEESTKFAWEALDTRELANRTAVLIYSSGTTGLPKGVEITHYNLVVCTLQQIHMQSDNSVKNRRSLCVLPMYHGLGLIYYIFLAPKLGVQTYLQERYELTSMLSYIERYRITELVLVPPIVTAIAKHPAAQQGKYNLSSIRKVLVGAAPLGMEITQQFEELLSDGVKVRQAWGMSELPCIGTCWYESESGGPSSIAVGELVPGVSAKLIREDETEETRRGHRGELWIKAPNIMKGYWRNEKATASTITSDGWLKSGDIAYVDDAGKWYVVDRKKELIKVRGAQVAPAELEALLLEHPQVVEAAVIGIKTASDDEDPMAFVLPRNRNNVTEDEIVQFVASKVSKIKRLTGGVVFVDSIPKTLSGKILRRELREFSARTRRAGAGVMARI